MRRTPLKPGKGFKPKLPPPRPVKTTTYSPRPREAAVRVNDGRARMVVQVPKPEKAKPGKVAPTVEERAWLDWIVAYGCVACRIDGFGVVPPAVHHLLRGGRRIGHLFSLPLCDPGHHQNGQQRGMVSRHPWRARFEQRYGSEQFLLDKLRAERAASVEPRRIAASTEGV